MGLFDSILSAVTGRADFSAEANPLIGVLSGLLAQSGGLQGLARKFSESGVGGVFSSWVGLGKSKQFPPTKFKKCSVPMKSKPSQPKSALIPAKSPIF
jgi:uncharacterized protein YidB (DUF937 family)